jgi:hypothetical protein
MTYHEQLRGVNGLAMALMEFFKHLRVTDVIDVKKRCL